MARYLGSVKHLDCKIKVRDYGVMALVASWSRLIISTHENLEGLNAAIRGYDAF